MVIWSPDKKKFIACTCVSKMDDVMKRLIYNSKLTLFTHSPYIIKPYKL